MPNITTARATSAATTTTARYRMSRPSIAESRSGTCTAASRKTTAPASTAIWRQITFRWVQLRGVRRVGPSALMTSPAVTTAMTPEACSIWSAAM